MKFAEKYILANHVQFGWDTLNEAPSRKDQKPAKTNSKQSKRGSKLQSPTRHQSAPKIFLFLQIMIIVFLIFFLITRVLKEVLICSSTKTFPACLGLEHILMA